LARRPGRVAANVLLDAATELRRAVPKVVALPAADPAAHLRPAAARPDDRPRHPARALPGLLRGPGAAGVAGRVDAELIGPARPAPTTGPTTRRWSSPSCCARRWPPAWSAARTPS